MVSLILNDYIDIRTIPNYLERKLSQLDGWEPKPDDIIFSYFEELLEFLTTKESIYFNPESKKGWIMDYNNIWRKIYMNEMGKIVSDNFIDLGDYYSFHKNKLQLNK